MSNNPLKYNLFKHIDEHLERPSITAPRAKNFYPSEASVVTTSAHGKTVHGKCQRAAFFRLSDDYERVGKNARSEYIFEYGHATERMITTWVKEMGIWVGNSIKFVDKEYGISGELDLVLAEPPDGQLYIGEVKSFYGYHATKELMGSKGKKGFPKMGQLLQTLIYVWYWRTRGLPYARMIYLARDSMDRTTFLVEIHDEGNIMYPKINGEIVRTFTINDVLARYKELAQYVENDQIPPNDFELDYPDHKIEAYYKQGKIGKTKYTAWKNGKLKPHERVGDWECFAPDTLVRLANGKYKPIQNIEIGDTVVGFDGPTKVVRVEAKTNTKPCMKIKPVGMLDTVCTEDHEWLTASFPSNLAYYQGKAFLPKMTRAKDLQTLATFSRTPAGLLVPVHDSYNAKSQLTDEECEFLGYYTAEGNVGNWQNNRYYQTHFTLNINEEKLGNRIIELGQKLFNCNYEKKIVSDKRLGQEDWKSLAIRFYSVKMADWVRTHVKGQKAINKNLSTSIMGATLSGVKAFLDAAESGDGSIDKNNAHILSTSSRILCNQYQQLYWRLNIPAVAQYANKPDESFGYKTHQGYRVQYQGENSHALRFITINKDRFILTRIRSNDYTEETIPEVWDIEVDSDYHLFTTESGIASNCNYCDFKHICWNV